MDVIIQDSAVTISLILPSGTEITSANASSNGFTFTSYDADGTGDGLGVLNSFQMSGTHTVIEFPASASPGTYRVKANASAALQETAVLIIYYPSSSVAVGAATDSATYRQGDLVVVSGLVFDGRTPIQNATVTAVAGAFLPVPGTIGNYQLVSTAPWDDGVYSLYTYSVQFTNSGGAAANVAATLTTTDPAMAIQDEVVGFGNAAAGATVTGGNTFSFLYPTASSFNLSALRWIILAPSTPINVTLTDSGPYDSATGDGIYTGTFTPSNPGEYTVMVKARGTSASGLAFVRSGSTSFRVVQPTALFSSFSDAAVQDVATGLIGAVNITASLNVQTAGRYQLSLQLTASNGKVMPGGASAQLNTGSGQIIVPFRADQMLALGVDGPYTIGNARLEMITSTDSIDSDYKDPAGTTQAYTLGGLSRGLFYFTGQYSATPSDTNGIPGYESLAIAVGVSQQPAGYCQVDGQLFAGSSLLDSASNSQYYSPGATSVTLNFNGYRIRSAGLNGPYTLRSVRVICGNLQVHGDNLFQTPAYTFGQFESGTADFSLTASPSVSASTVRPVLIPVTIGRSAGFNQAINFAVTGVPSGSVATLYFATVQNSGQMSVAILTSSTAAGSYPLTITGTSGSVVHSVNVTLVVSAAPSITGVTSPAADGKYDTGAAIPITISFTNPVTVTGTPMLALNSGGAAAYTSGSGTGTLTFTYTVGAGQSSADLDYSPTNALSANGGTLNGPSGSPAILELPNPGAPGSLGFNKNIVIDTSAPGVVSYNVLFGSQSFNVIGSGRNRLPWQITGIQVVFSKAITAGNINSLSGVAATGFSGLGTTTLTWTISPVSLASLATTLAGMGPNALKAANGAAIGGGVDFNQALKVLWGDVNDDGVVNGGDLVLIRNATGAPYNIIDDVNGDGVVDFSDVQIARTRLGTTLP